MRRWQPILAFSMASILCLPAVGERQASAQDPPLIASGAISDTTGHPLAGEVELLAWPTGKDIAIGQTAPLVSVGQGRVSRDGRFALTSEVTPELADLASHNGGYVNFELRTMAGGTMNEADFSRYLAAPTIAAQGTGKSRRPAWRAAPDEEGIEPLHVTIDGTPSSPDAIRPMQGGCYGMTLIDRQIAATTIGELRAPGDTTEAAFVYGKRADSAIAVAERSAYGPWAISGTFHLANSQSAAVTQWAHSGEHVLVRSRFTYDRYEYFCPSGRKEKVVPHDWFGDVQSQPTEVRGCGKSPEARRGHYGANTGFDRTREKATKWDGAADVFGASLTAQSGYSQFVQGHWTFGSEGDHLLCGDDGPPAKAQHIFAGPSA
jgi:hypothetical protein